MGWYHDLATYVRRLGLWLGQYVLRVALGGVLAGLGGRLGQRLIHPAPCSWLAVLGNVAQGQLFRKLAMGNQVGHIMTWQPTCVV
jgi:hypothetical protein